MKTNVFWQEYPEPAEILQDPELEAVIKGTLKEMFEYFELSNPDGAVLEILHNAKKPQSINSYESTSNDILVQHGLRGTLREKRASRSKLVYEQLRPYLIGSSILDLGCGDGNIGALVSGKQVTLADIYRHTNVGNTKLPFVLLRQGVGLPFRDNEFDCTMMTAVLHHSDDPEQLLREAYRVTKDRVIVIETVYGLAKEDFKDLDVEQQRKFTIFFDHFSNCVIQYQKDPKKRINCPFNFQTPENWQDSFEKIGFHQEKMVPLGFDQPAVKEYHTLHVLKKQH